MKIALIENDKIDAFITQVEKDAGKLQNKIHRVAVSIIKVWHDADKKDKKATQEAAQLAAERLTALGNASPYHRNAFFRWVALTGLHWADPNKTWFAHAGDDMRMMGKLFMELRDKPFWEVSPPPQAKPFIMAAELQRLLDRAAKHLQNPVDGDKLNIDALNKLRTVVAEMNAEFEPDF